jgi:hypothetical protein
MNNQQKTGMWNNVGYYMNYPVGSILPPPGPHKERNDSHFVAAQQPQSLPRHYPILQFSGISHSFHVLDPPVREISIFF